MNDSIEKDFSEMIKKDPDLFHKVISFGIEIGSKHKTPSPDTVIEINGIKGQMSIANKDLIEIKGTIKSVRNWLAGSALIILAYVFWTGSWKGTIDEKIYNIDSRISKIESKVDNIK